MKRHAVLLALVAAAIASPLSDPPTKPKDVVAPPAAATGPERGIGTGVTEKIAPPGGPPPKCNIAYNGKFGIAVQNITVKKLDIIPAAAPAVLPVPNAVSPVDSPAETTPPPPAAEIVKPDSPPPEGGVTTSTRTNTQTVTVRRTVVGQEMRQSVYVVSQIEDGQIQAPTAPTLLQRTTFGAVPAAPAVATPEGPNVPLQPAGDAPLPAAVPPMAGMSGMSLRRAIEAPPDNPVTQFVSCITKGTLNMTLEDGVLKDDKGRTGYIASNYQFQFDGPPQSGALYTAGFSVCSNGSLALGGSTTWYQCRSGDFYNLYDRWWAPQCNPVTINAVMLKQC